MYCINCGTMINDDFDFCPECGTAKFKVQSEKHVETIEKKEKSETSAPTEFIIDEKNQKQEIVCNDSAYCIECGTKLVGGEDFCPECGSPVFKGLASTVGSTFTSIDDKSVVDEEKDLNTLGNDHNDALNNEETPKEDNVVFCTECGNKIDDGYVFCPKCGKGVFNAQINDGVLQNNKKISDSKRNQLGNKKEKTKGGKIIRLAISGAITLIAIAGIIIFAIIKSHTIDLNEFIRVDYSGYDTKGHAEVIFDEEAFLEKYGDRIKIKDMDERIYDLRKQLGNSASAAAILLECIDVNIDKTCELTNGDIVTTSWFVDDEIIRKEFNCRLVHDDITHEVAGLNDVVEGDIFDGVHVYFNDYSPYIEAYISGGSYSGINYSLNKDYNLRGGETIQLTASTIDGSPLEDYCIEFYGIRPTSDYKEIIVSGGSYYNGMYVERWSDLTQDAVDDIVNYANGCLWEYIDEAYYSWDGSGSWTSAIFVNKDLILLCHIKLTIKAYGAYYDDYDTYYKDYYVAVPIYNVLRQGDRVTYSFDAYGNGYSIPRIEFNDGIHRGGVYIESAFLSESTATSYFNQFDLRNIDDFVEHWD